MNKYWAVVKITPEHRRFKSDGKHSYIAISKQQYYKEYEKQHDRLYCAWLSKEHAEAMAKHLNRNSYETFHWKGDNL